MPGHERLLKKVEQERAKGQLDRALGRLKEAITEHPRDFELAREAAGLCFEMGRTLEGANILRAAIKRCPGERAFALELLQREFAANHQAELGEILYETYLAQGDLDRARDVVVNLADGDRAKMLAKLQTKIASVKQEAPPDAAKRLVSLHLAEALTLSALQRPADFAAALDSALDLDAGLVQTVGHLAKLESRQHPESAPVHLLLARCYSNVKKPELAAEHAVVAGRDAAALERATGLLDAGSDSPPVLRARAELLLRAGRHREAGPVLASLLDSELHVEALVRQTFEAVPEALTAMPAHRLLLARALASTGAARLALKELEAAQGSGVDPDAALTTAEAILSADPRNVDAMLTHARCAMTANRLDVASTSLLHVLEVDPSRAETLRREIETACSKPQGGALRRLLVDLYLKLEMPQEAAETLDLLREAGDAAPSVLYQLSGDIAGTYGFSARLLLVFVESALETEHADEARAAVAHYLASPGARMQEFTRLLEALLVKRPELASRLAPVVEGLQLPVQLRFGLALASLEVDGSTSAVAELERLLAEHTELRQTALDALEAHLAKQPGSAEALLLAADLADTGGRALQSCQYLARALRSAPAETDRICKLAERVLQRSPSNHLCWREIIFALVDVQRARHAREFCHLALQVLPAEKQGMIHVANAELLLASNQAQAAVNELEGALASEDVPVDRVVGLLERAVDADSKHGYARFVLAAALLRQGHELDTAVIHLTAAVQLDDLLVDLALELLGEHAEILGDHAPALVLHGLLLLRKGERARGVHVLDRALELQPLLAPQVLPTLEAEWDRDPQNSDLGITFARALRGAGHGHRACRLALDLARRFPDRQERLLGELESMLDAEPAPDVHRALWEILLERGRLEAATEHLQHAVEGTREPEALRDLLVTASARMPESSWVACRLAELEFASGQPDQAAAVLRAAFEHQATLWEPLLECLRGLPSREPNDKLLLLEFDLLLCGHRGQEALAVLERFRAAFEEAREAAASRYSQLVERKLVGPVAELELALMQRGEGRIEEAVATLEAGLERGNALSSPSEDDTRAVRELRLTLAQLYVELGRESEGKELVASVLDRPGDHQETYGFLERLARQGMLSRLKALRETISSYPGNMRARLELARLSIVSMDFEGARDALSFTGDTAAIEAARRYLLARSHADEDHPDLALAVLRSIALEDLTEEELRRNVAYLKGVSCEQLGLYSEAHAYFLQILSEFPYYKDVRERVRRTYQKHLETALVPRAEVLEKRTQLDVSESK